MGDNMNLLYRCCMDKENIKHILRMITSNIKLSENSISKCVMKIKNLMEDNISRLKHRPKNNDEITEIVRSFNRICANTITEYISKKYPSKFINKRQQVNNQHFNRELDTMGRRTNHVQDRPFTRSKKEMDDEDNSGDYNMKKNYPDVNKIGYRSVDQMASGYASAFDNHMITNVPLVDSNNVPLNKNQHRQAQDAPAHQQSNALTDRFNQYSEQYKREFNGPPKPSTPNYSLDMNDDQFRKMRESNKMDGSRSNLDSMYESMNGGGNNNSQEVMGNNTSDRFGEMLYESVLGEGAPNTGTQNPQTEWDPRRGMQEPPRQMNNQGMDNPLMPMPSGIMMDRQQFEGNNYQGGYGNQGGHVNQVKLEKQTYFSDAYTRALSEREKIDAETNQRPLTTQNNGSKYDNPQMGGFGQQQSGQQQFGFGQIGQH
jgi:hypothetical protein